MKLEPLDKKLEAFGFSVITVGGHDFAALEKARQFAESSTTPCAIICNTTKGRSWKQYEDTVDCHYLPMKDDQYGTVIAEVENDYKSQMALLEKGGAKV
ncbi:MAG TPA: hypothetical protein VG603_14540, partial [Chitinophagales bacterium]|nr:hypothetical protein [Chitinophagales bacterium]